MCGIAGILRWNGPSSPAAMRAMTDSMSLRGPDAEGLVSLKHIDLGHRRLSIIDTSDAGTQPMFDHTGRFCIVFNGEIYNYQSLRREIPAGVFRSGTDTEVILEAYKVWGRECVHKFNGMFAFAIWDTREESLFIARDRLGQKPLFYAELPEGGLIFASELKAITATGLVDSRLSYEALGQFMALGYTLAPLTLLENVRKLEPAQALWHVQGRQSEIWEYWNLSEFFLSKRSISETQACDELEELLDQAVALRMISDVPLGAFLSGGVDSAGIVSSMKRNSARNGSQVLTFSLGFQERSYSELPEAAAAAEHLQSVHHEQVLTPSVAADLEMILASADEPIADNSLIPMFYLARFARERVTVALSGDAGDELFAGYETYVADYYHQLLRGVPTLLKLGTERLFHSLAPVSFAKVSFDFKMRRFLKGLCLPFERAHYSWREFFPQTELRQILHPDVYQEVIKYDPFSTFARHYQTVAKCHYLDRAMYADLKTWLPNNILVKADRSSMANSLELRSPFLDYRLVEFAASLPVQLKLKQTNKKYILKKFLERRLPRELLHRKKRGFNAPVSEWLNGDLQSVVHSVFKENTIFSADYAKRLLFNHQQQQQDNSFKLYALLCMQMWLNQQSVLQPVQDARSSVVANL